ncbi:hypothetical protein HAX54_011205 [Datura stramonium]|uniref:Uncharacterized protein n=1 Tax=Datura stramonium TaxID=4076 RepID=A0ABS8THH7_DATST|nr:hypothetical protein [Datura stramonium]
MSESVGWEVFLSGGYLWWVSGAWVVGFAGRRGEGKREGAARGFGVIFGWGFGKEEGGIGLRGEKKKERRKMTVVGETEGEKMKGKGGMAVVLFFRRSGMAGRRGEREKRERRRLV